MKMQITSPNDFSSNSLLSSFTCNLDDDDGDEDEDKNDLLTMLLKLNTFEHSTTIVARKSICTKRVNWPIKGRQEVQKVSSFSLSLKILLQLVSFSRSSLCNKTATSGRLDGQIKLCHFVTFQEEMR